MKKHAHDEVLSILDGLEERFDRKVTESIRERHIRSASWQPVDRPPVVLVPPWDRPMEKLYPVSEAVRDPSKMMVNELRRGFSCIMDWFRVRDDKPLQIRPNFGIGLVASVFGARVEVVENNPPWVHPIVAEDKEREIARVVDSFDAGKCHTGGWLPRITETVDYFTRVLSQYPKAASCIALTMPDLQGPFDTAAMVWGSDIFLALLTQPDLISRFLEAIGAAMVHIHSWIRRWIGRELLPEGFSHQHGTVIRGNLLLRCDSNVMMNPQMYASQVFVHDRKVLQSVGTGGFHSCGRWMQNIPTVLEAEEVGTLDFGSNQSHMNDVDQVYRDAGRKKKHLNLVAVKPEELESGSIVERFPTGATLQCHIDSVDAAARVMEKYAAR